MIEGFARQTKDLSPSEKKLLNSLVYILHDKEGKGRAMKNKDICDALRRTGHFVSPARLRKLINYIRLKGMVPCLMASSKGYYITHNRKEMEVYIKSLLGREAAIREVREAMEEQFSKNTSSFE